MAQVIPNLKDSNTGHSSLTAKKKQHTDPTLSTFYWLHSFNNS